jgi:phosphopantothenoylcysteine decarboxylase
MNTCMFEHPLTAMHIATIRDVIGYKVMGPQMGKKLACGDSGEPIAATLQ